MPSLSTIALSIGLTLAIPAFSGASAHAASACQNISQVSERGKLRRLLSSSGVSKSEGVFLVTGAEQRLKEVKPSALNARGAECGIAAVRSHILGCMNSSLPSILPTIPQGRKASKALWGRTGLSARGAAFIGIFHTCRGAAAEAFLKQ